MAGHLLRKRRLHILCCRLGTSTRAAPCIQEYLWEQLFWSLSESSRLFDEEHRYTCGLPDRVATIPYECGMWKYMTLTCWYSCCTRSEDDSIYSRTCRVLTRWQMYGYPDLASHEETHAVTGVDTCIIAYARRTLYTFLVSGTILPCSDKRRSTTGGQGTVTWIGDSR